MTVQKDIKLRDFEPRWPVAFMIFAVIGLLALMPQRIQLLPYWAAYIGGIIVLIPVAAAGISGGNEFWTKIESKIIIIFFIVNLVNTLVNLGILTSGIVNGSVSISGIRLLISSVAVWMINITIFSLLYWQLDRGGPEARIRKKGVMPNWIFPEENAPDGYVREGWHPSYLDYLFLSFSTATAFSTTDIIPLRSGAKLLMMMESSISLTMIALVVSRAINILGN